MFLTTIASLGLTAVGFADVAPPSSLDYDVIRAVATQHDGRWPPLDTVARDLVNSVTGDEIFNGADPVGMLLGWTFDAHSWRKERIIPIRNAELRRELQLSPDHKAFSFNELVSHKPLHALVDELASIPEGQKPNPLQSKVRNIHDKLQTLQSIFSGQELRLVPNPNDAMAPWSGVNRSDATSDLSKAYSSLAESYKADDATGFAKASEELVSLLNAQPAAFRPSQSLIDAELRYNALQPFRTAWRIMVVGALLAAAALFVRARSFDVIATIGIALGFAALTYGLWLRWQIAGRIPASNMFESLLFLSWGAGLFAVVSRFFVRNRSVPLTASAMGALALMLADVLPMNHFIRPIAPVLLDTVWMSIHVPVIMVSYSVLAIGVIIAHAQLITMALSPRNRELAVSIDTLHCWYLLIGSYLLLVGIITGSMWAASSWGRYWGWDPKEVWSLVALLGYLTILHVRIDADRVPRWAYGLAVVAMIAMFVIVVPKLAPITFGKMLGLGGAAIGMVLFVLAQGPFAAAFKSILAFWLIIMTYVGVNYVLGVGLHSYGFGTGAMSKYMLRLGSADLLFAVLCTAVYLWRRARSDIGSAALAVA